MSARSLAIAVVAAVALAAATAATAVSATTLTRCGTVTFDRKVLPAYAQGVSCSAARTLLKKLAGLPHPGRPMHVYPGRYSGMLCAYSAQLGASVGVTCNNPSHTKLVAAGKRTG